MGITLRQVHSHSIFRRVEICMQLGESTQGLKPKAHSSEKYIFLKQKHVLEFLASKYTDGKHQKQFS